MSRLKLFIISTAIVSVVACNSQNKQIKNGDNAPDEKKVEAMAVAADPQILAGQWERRDGGYRLVLEEIKPDGSLKASYFNPGNIHVHQSNWKLENEKLQVFVELRDTNYPGSTYTLIYDKDSDVFTGTYFQAALNQYYDIEFARIK